MSEIDTTFKYAELARLMDLLGIFDPVPLVEAFSSGRPISDLPQEAYLFPAISERTRAAYRDEIDALFADVVRASGVHDLLESLNDERQRRGPSIELLDEFFFGGKVDLPRLLTVVKRKKDAPGGLAQVFDEATKNAAAQKQT
ncbi:hypothetical protein [Nocardia blacklockiae]|uniref:hypothetical protein n=1 Tax=Nocardia blacklockiae TaxID=480036 RepID=UPI0018943879|nr:hypothetical protein [Nocardia blacklockiae]MBF6176031.1 hypothetical protein [Nocardia blacklockiae]